MRTAITGFFFGVLLLQPLAQLPGPAVYAILAPALWLVCAGRRARIAGWVLLGFLWAVLRADWRLATVLDERLEGEALVVAGRIEDLPVATSFGTQFRMRVGALHRDDEAVSHPGRIELNWYGRELPVVAGAECRLYVRLKRPHGRRNPGGSDYERWLFAQGIGATGYVIGHPRNACRSAGIEGAIARARSRIAARVRAVIADPAERGALGALTVADVSAIDDAQWSVLRNTGTTHLISISGLHISLVAGLAYALTRWLWAAVVPLARRWPAQHAGALAAMVAALGYAALAGFSLPTQRALIMVAIAMGYQWLGRRIVSTDTYLVALAAVLVHDPHAVLSVSFWLSFGAVGVLVLLACGRVGRASWGVRILGVHLAMAVGLGPLLAAVFQAIPLSSPIANLVAVPWGSLVVVPLALLALACSELGLGLDVQVWHLAGHAWGLLWKYLVWLAAVIEPTVLPSRPGMAATVIATTGAVLLLLPRGLAGRGLAPALLLTLALPAPRDLGPGDFRVTVLDVGQGLAAVVETATHVLTYDAGPSYAGGSDSGRSVVVPFLRARGRAQVDVMMLSHGDNDHAGGAAAVVAGVAVGAVLSSPGYRFGDHSAACRQGTVWRWDEVRFEILYPGPEDRGSDNELSCVLRVSGRGGSALLPGDVERFAELALVTRYGRRLHADVIVAPHHGSRTSSSVEFVRAVQARYAVFSVGYRNRFGFPDETVLRRYEASGTRVLRTDVGGAIGVTLRDRPSRPTQFRADARRYWHRLPTAPAR